jgi:hypothetical protein
MTVVAAIGPSISQMATSMAHEVRDEDWAGPLALADGEGTTLDEWLWALISVALLVALLVLVVDDRPLRALTAGH